MEITETVTTTYPSSHDYARELQRVAEFLLRRQAFAWPFRPYFYTSLPLLDKEQFLAVVRGLGSGKKEITDSLVKFTATMGDHDSQIEASIHRNKVCRLVRPAEYECEPFFSKEEEQSLGGAA